MNSPGLALFHICLIVSPLLAAVVERPPSRRTALNLCVAELLLALSLALTLGPAGATTLAYGEHPLLVLDSLNLWLMPFTVLLYLATLLSTPRADRSGHGKARLLAALSFDLAFMSVVSPVAMAVIWPLTHWPLLAEVRNQGLPSRRLLRILVFYFVPGCLFFSIGAVAVTMDNSPPLWALIAITVGIAFRKAIVPFHQWLPELFEKGPLTHAILFCTPQLGAYATVRLLATQAPESLLVGLGMAALVTSVYGACLAVGKNTVRGAFAGMLMGQTSLVFAGLQCTTHSGLAGGLALWISGGMALTGLGLAVMALEARRGPLMLNTYQGGHALSPVLATCFLILGLTSVGFPGTLGFVSQELLLHGTTHAYPLVGVLAAVTTTLNGITIMRLYLCMFCGRRVSFTVSQSIRLRERVAMFVLVALLLGLGFLPQSFVAGRWQAAQDLMEVRQGAFSSDR
jgi:NADH-quinone oxidoreductase subunit M